MADIIIPVETTFHAPEGTFKGSLVHHKQTEDHAGKIKSIRLIWKILVPWMQKKNVLAGKTYADPLKEHSEFMEDLRSWLGSAYIDSLAGEAFDVEAHYGRPAELKLFHSWNKGHDHPYAVVQGVYPVGTLELTQQKGVLV